MSPVDRPFRDIGMAEFAASRPKAHNSTQVRMEETVMKTPLLVLCQLTNKRGAWSAEVPSVVSVRKSDDALKYQCKTKDGREAVGSIESEMGAKIVASAVFLDLGITDAITDKHRKYVESYVIPVKPREGGDEDSANASTKIYTELQQLEDLRKQGIITDGEFAAQKKKILDAN